MATINTITEAMKELRANGVRGGPAWGPSEDARASRRLAVRTWAKALADVSDSDLEHAIGAFLRDPKVCQWWPQPGLLLARIPGAKAAATDTADEAWGQMLRYANAFAWRDQPISKWRQVLPSHIDAHAVVAGIRATGGMQVMGLGQEDQMMTHRAAFRSAYRSVAARHVADREDNVIELALGVGEAHRLFDGRA